MQEALLKRVALGLQLIETAMQQPDGPQPMLDRWLDARELDDALEEAHGMGSSARDAQGAGSSADSDGDSDSSGDELFSAGSGTPRGDRMAAAPPCTDAALGLRLLQMQHCAEHLEGTSLPTMLRLGWVSSRGGALGNRPRIAPLHHAGMEALPPGEAAMHACRSVGCPADQGGPTHAPALLPVHPTAAGGGRGAASNQGML